MKIPYLRRSFAFLPLLGLLAHVQAQQVSPCGTDEQYRRLMAADPSLAHKTAQYELGLQEYLQAKAGLRDDGDTVVYVLPVVFHILYDPTAPNDNHNLPNSVIFDQVNRLNIDYAKLNADTIDIVDPFKPIAANIHVRFELATKDPFGNCTNGIDRIVSQRSSNAQDFSKLNPWFRNNYVNVWVIRSLQQDTPGQITLAYSQLPPSVQDDFGALRDGVIMLSSTVGSSTLTHELGHFLNLEHPWGSTNSPEVACGDDNVEDTPVTKGHFSCDLYDFTCSSWPAHSPYTFDDVNTTSGTTDPTPPPVVLFQDTLEPGLSLSPFTANGVSSNPTGNGAFYFSQWGTGATQGDSQFTQLTGAINTGKYYQFSVQPTFGKSMSIHGLTFNVSRTSTGPRTFAVRASIGNYSSNLAASVVPANSALSVQSGNVFFFNVDTAGITNGSTITVPNLTWSDPSSYNHIKHPVTFRIYAWNAEDVDGSFSVDSVSLKADFGNVENTQNYMDYSGCSVMFTDGQRDRMRATLNSSVSGRSNLWQENNHSYTGTNGFGTTCGPQADFYALERFVCPGVTVSFKDNSTRATPTSWAWTFDGGTPATSNQQNPSVSFSEPGYHNVTLTVGNDHGSNSITKADAVLIGADYGQVDGLVNEGFNTNGAFSKWPNLNWENNQTYWYWTDQTGHNAPGCAKLNASATYHLVQDLFVPNNFADKDLLVTPMLDMRFNTGLQFSFWYAYASQTGVSENITEQLKVYSSSDCGNTWSLRKTIAGGDLLTAGVRSPGYVPTANEWSQATFAIPNIYANNHVRFMFEFTSGLYSNDVYIDDVNINGTNVGIDELARNGGLALMPNPATDQLTVNLDLGSSSAGTLSILDMTGRLVHTQGVSAGQTELHLDLGGIGVKSGVYLVRLKHAAGQSVERLVVR